MAYRKIALCYWENERNEPRIYQFPAIISFLGYYPFDHETETLGGKLLRYKHEHGLTNRGLGKAFGVDESTVAQWVRNERLPLKRSMEKVLVVINKNAAH